MPNSVSQVVDESDSACDARPALSVCIASYDGEQFIETQLASILSQIGSSDEIVIVDDASSDRTCERVDALGDARIKLIRHRENAGVVVTFEEAIRAATKPIIFLADQDDVWMADKVQAVCSRFIEDATLMLVIHDATLVDDEGSVIGSSFLGLRGGFSRGLMSNLWKNRYVGCMLAFRSELRTDILPFPRQDDLLHDMWIGVRCAWKRIKVSHIDRPLMYYRRHSATATGRRRNSLLKQLLIRTHLIAALVWHRAQG